MKTRRNTRRDVWPAWHAPALAVVALTLLPCAASAQVVEYYHLDAVGNVRAISNQAGQIVRHHDYLPFGEEWNAQADPQPRRFTGKERDAETGMDYFGARYYAAGIGRFTTVDPAMTIQANLTDPQRWNRYAYGKNNPLRYVDPDGRVGRDMTGADVQELQRRAAAAGPSNNVFLDGVLPGMGVALTGAPLLMMAAEAAPLAWIEAHIAVGACLSSGGCQNGVRGLAEGVSGAPPGAMGLTPAQATKLARFNKKLPVGSTGTHVDELGDGVLFTAEVPGRVRGSKAVYQKAVDGSGETSTYLKTTVDPAGEVVHIKDKLVSEK